MRAAAFGPTSQAIGADLPREPRLQHAPINEQLLLLDRDHEHLGALEDGSGADLADRAISGEGGVIFVGLAAAEAGEVAGAEFVGARVEGGGRGRGHELGEEGEGEVVVPLLAGSPNQPRRGELDRLRVGDLAGEVKMQPHRITGDPAKLWGHG